MVQRPRPSSFAILSMTCSGMGPSPSYQSDRADIIDAMHSVLESCGRMLIVPLSMSSRSASTTAGIWASSQSLQPQRHVDLGLRHQPVAHLRHDAVVGLHEQLGGGRAETALVERPHRVVLHRTRAGPQKLSVGQHDLKPAVRRLVDAIGHVGESVLKGVGDDSAPADVDDGGREVVAAGLDGVVEVVPADAWLDDRVAELLVDLRPCSCSGSRA